MKYIGDLSIADAALLEHVASQVDSILEFGVGGSTQVMAQAKSPGCTMTSVDTDIGWIFRTMKNLADLGVDGESVTFLEYENWQDKTQGLVFDLVFVDGVDDKRLEFARLAWQRLRLGGVMLFHDTRRSPDMANMLRVLHEHQNEIGDVYVNLHGSNISGFEKKEEEPYRNWNEDEDREPWMYGAGMPPDNWVDLLEGE